MTGEVPRTPPRVSGKPSFVAAHAMTAARPELSFDEAFALSRLVLERAGGPEPVTGKVAFMSKATATRLTTLGLAEIEGSSEFTQRVLVQLTADGRLSELLSTRLAGVVVTPVETRQKAKWLVAATAEGVELVAASLPSDTESGDQSTNSPK